MQVVPPAPVLKQHDECVTASALHVLGVELMYNMFLFPQKINQGKYVAENERIYLCSCMHDVQFNLRL